MGHNDVWSIDDLLKKIGEKGKYILFSATRENNASHKLQLETIHSQKSETDKLLAWKKSEPVSNYHAIGV